MKCLTALNKDSLKINQEHVKSLCSCARGYLLITHLSPLFFPVDEKDILEQNESLKAQIQQFHSQIAAQVMVYFYLLTINPNSPAV